MGIDCDALCLITKHPLNHIRGLATHAGEFLQFLKRRRHFRLMVGNDGFSECDNIFRLVHTIKGTCGFLGLPRLETLAHAAETVMGKFRDGMPATSEAVTVLPLAKQLPVDAEHEEKMASPGKLSVTVTFWASDPPLF